MRTQFSLFSTIGIKLILFGIITSCTCEAEQSSDRLQIMVVIPPQQYFVERVAGDRAEVTVLLPPGANPHTYEPRPADLAVLSRADIYFQLGLPFEEAWLPRLRSAETSTRFIDMLADIDLIMDDEHNHGHHNPHVWLSARSARTITGNIARELSDIDPQYARQYQENARDFIAELDALDAEFAERLRPFNRRTLLMHHPAWVYFARDYDLTILAIEEHGSEPGAGRMADVIEQARRLNLRTVFVQPTINPRTADMVAGDIQGRIVVLENLSYEWEQNMRTAVDEFERALQESNHAE